jgi:phospholipid/cholesterol/gamma-HCH transport system substrate-binding protein
MNKSQTVSIGFFFLLGIGLLWIVQNELSSNAVKKQEGYEIVASFNNLLQLRTGDDVRMAGVRIGTVQYTGLVDRVPTAIFKIDREFQIPVDSVASISMSGLLGNNMIAIQMGSAEGAIAPGGSIETRVGYDINHVVNEIGALSKQVGGALGNFEKMLAGDGDNESLFTILGSMLRENQAALKATVANLEVITSQLASGEGTIGKLLMDDEIYQDLRTVTAQLKTTLKEGEGLVTDARSIVQHVQSGQGTVGQLIYGESDIAAEVEALVAELRAFSEKLNNPDSTIGKLMNDSELYTEVQGLMRKAGQTLDGMGDTAPLSALGSIVSPLF